MRSTYLGFGNGGCFGSSVGPDQDVTVNLKIGRTVCGPTCTQEVEWSTLLTGITYYVHWISEPATYVSASANPPIEGLPIEIRSTVDGVWSSSEGIQFEIDGKNFGPPVAITNGVATLNITSWMPGIHTIVASFLGNRDYMKSVSTPMTLNVLTKTAAAQSLTSRIDSMNLPQNTTQVLDEKLHGTIDSLNSGHNHFAKNELRSFIQEVKNH